MNFYTWFGTHISSVRQYFKPIFTLFKRPKTEPYFTKKFNLITCYFTYNLVYQKLQIYFIKE